MGIYLRKNSPHYWMSFCVNGKQVKRTTGTDNKVIAKRIYDSVKGKVALGKWIPEELEQKEVTFKDLIPEYLKWAERQKGIVNKKGFIKQLSVCFENLYLNEFDTRLLEQYQTQRLQQGNKPATVNRHIATLKHMFTKASDWNMVTEDTLKKIRKCKNLPENNKRLRYLSKEECHSLINASDPHLRPIVITALSTGMRKEEILSLERDKHIDLKHGFILLDKTKNGERREIPINQTLRDTLQRMPARLDSPYVFTDNEGNRYKDVKRSFKSALKRTGIKDFRFHDLRHTFASHLVMAGVDLTTVSRLLGHKSLTMTLRYAHLAPTHMAEAVKKISDILGVKTPNLGSESPLNYPNFRTLDNLEIANAG